MPAFVNEVERKEILAYFFDRFGIPGAAFEGFRLLKEKRTIYAAADAPGLENILEKLKVEAAGVPLLRLDSSGWKPTPAGLQLFAERASRNTLDLDEDSMEAFLKQGMLEGPLPLDPGYVILRWEGSVMGCGLYGKRGLRSQIREDLLRRLKGKDIL